MIRVHEADCVAWLREHDGAPFSAVVTDPPYEIGFMGRDWDRSGVAFRPDTWAAALDRMLPGAHLVAFSSTRTYHRLACAIEDAGFEIRDQLAWCYGSGFPKSLDVSKAIDKAAGLLGAQAKGFNAAGGIERTNGGDPLRSDHPDFVAYAPRSPEAEQWQGWGTALKPAWEPICLARKPLGESTVAANVLRYGTGAINVDGCRVDVGESTLRANSGGTGNAENWRTGSRASTTGSRDGRFPANLLHDGSPEVLAGFPETNSGGGPAMGAERTQGVATGKPNANNSPPLGNNIGSAGRFFDSANAGPLDRIGSQHTTVKPVDVMRWLVRMVTPPGGTVLDCFAGSGSTGIAALVERFDCDLVELLPEHVADIRRKLDHLNGKGRRTMRDHLSARKAKPADDGGLPLFGG
jgi:DNA modification methylase